MNARLLLIFLLLFSKSPIEAQNLQEITVADGLSHSYIYQIYQTKDGYIWISTNDGLNRYDGYNFKVFQPDSKNPFSISDELIKGIYEDRKGRLWLSTQDKGLNVFDRIQNKFYHTQLKSKIQNKEENIRGFEIVEDTDGNIWVGGSQSTVFKVEVPKSWAGGYPNNADFTDEVKITPLQVSNDKKDIRQIYLENSTLWVGSTTGKVFKINTKTLQKTEVLLQSESKNNSHQSVTGIFKDKSGTIWISQLNEGIYRISNEKIEKIKHPSITNFDYHYWLDETGFVWVKTPKNEVYRIFCKDFAAFKFGNPIFHSKSQSYKSFLTTPENILFVGDVRGIKKIDIRAKPIKHLLKETDFTEVFRTRKGENLVSGIGETTLYHENEPNLPKLIFPDIIRARFFQSKNGEIWAACLALKDDQKYLYHYSENLQFIESFPLNQRLSNPIPVLTEDAEGNIWITATLGILHKFDIKTKQISTFDFKHILSSTSDVQVKEPFQIIQTPNKSLWIATKDGLVEATNIDSKPTFKLHPITKNSDLKRTEVYSIASDPLDPMNYLWLGTKDFGLVKMNIQTGKCEFFTKNEGLPSNNIAGILTDSHKNLWVSTNRGLFRFKPATKEVNLFTRSDGLQGELYNKKAFYKTINGELIFGGNNGINVFNPQNISNKLTNPNVKITDIEVNNQSISTGDENEILEKSIENTNEIELKSDQNTIRISFAVLDYTDSENNFYRYKLEGIDKSLVDAGTTNSATYVSLPAGSYIFKLYGSNRGGNWNKKPLTLQITVLPAWYRTWWAYLLYFSIIAYIFYRFYQNQLNKVRLQEQLHYKNVETKRLEELDQLKTNFFTNISHEFRTPLTLLVSPLDDLQKKYPQEGIIGLMKRNLQRLQMLINQLLDLSKLDAGEMKVNLQGGDLAVFIRQLLASFESLAQNKNIIFQTEQSHQHFNTTFDADKIEKIITNLLSNAFKFTPESGRVQVRIDYSPQPPDGAFNSSVPNSPSGGGGAVITVQDFGIGIEQNRLDKIFDRFYQVEEHKNQEGTGIGLALVKELVDVMKGKITVESEVGKGTKFEITIPFSPAPDGGVIQPYEIINPKIELYENEKEGNSFGLVAKTPPSGAEGLLLVIEDNPDLRMFFLEMLGKNFQIIEAVDGQDGVEKAFEMMPDLIITDLMMPRMDGYGVCKTLKNDFRTSHIPIIMLTAKATQKDKNEGLELGADDYLAKPFNTNELRIRVANLIKQREQLRLKFSQQVLNGKDEISKEKTPSIDDKFLEKAYQIIDKNLGDSSFDVEQFGEALAMSRTTLHRKLKAISDQSTTEFIRNYRLQKAANLLKNKAGSVSEVAYQVGFESLPYFSKSFQEHFGVNPSEFGKD